MPIDVSGKKIRFASFEVDFNQREIRKRGMRVRLQHKPFQILELLLRQPGALVGREEIARHLWPDSRVSIEHGLNTAVNALRQALGDTGQSSRFIETRAGLGYCFVAPVEEMAAPKGRLGRQSVHEDCRKGAHFLDKMTEQDVHKGLAYFESALKDECLPAVAYAGLSDGWCEFARLSVTPARTAGSKAKEFAILALSSDSNSAEAHVAMARVKMLFDWDLKSARAEYERALELAAGCAAAHGGYASLLAALKETESSLEHARTAQSLEPLSLRIGVEYAWILYARRDSEQAVQQCWKVLALEPRGWMAQLVLGLSYQQLGMLEEAIAEMQNAVICSGRHPVALGALGHLDAGNGEGVLLELSELAQRRYVNPLSFALAHAGLGQESATRECTRRAWEERDIYLHWFKQTSLLAPFIGANVSGSAH